METEPTHRAAAFPYTFDRNAASETGMSLRDYFAARATEWDIAMFIPETVGDCATLMHKLGWTEKPAYQESIRHCTPELMTRLRYRAKYLHADAMLAARITPAGAPK